MELSNVTRLQARPSAGFGDDRRSVVASVNDLTERHGFGSMATSSPPNFQLFSLKDDPDGLWIAEDGGAILGFAWSWVCGDVWFLAQLLSIPPNRVAASGINF